MSNAGASTIEKITSGGVGSVFASTGTNEPVGLAFDSVGNLFAVSNSGTIQKFTTGGVGSVFATGLNNPQFLAFTTDAGVPLPLANQVPEPSAVALMLGTGGLLVLLRRHPCGDG